MVSVRTFRILLLINILMIIALVIALYFDSVNPLLSPLINQADKINSTSEIKLFTYFSLLDVMGIFCIILAIYSFTALWIGHYSGKWTFLLLIIFGEIPFVSIDSVNVMSATTILLNETSILLNGIILTIAFLLPPVFIKTKRISK